MKATVIVAMGKTFAKSVSATDNSRSRQSDRKYRFKTFRVEKESLWPTTEKMTVSNVSMTNQEQAMDHYVSRFTLVECLK
jgi:hypothetical protein